MLLELIIKNYKSFYNETAIDMFADNAKKEYKERLINVTGKSSIKKSIVPAMVIYGANASGKTSLISAIDTLKQIVINGTIKKQIKNKAIQDLDICSFIHDNEKMKEPIHLEITFKTELYIYNYVLDINATYSTSLREVAKEELNVIEYKNIGTSIKENKINLFKRYQDKVEFNIHRDAIEILGKQDNFIIEAKNLEKTFSENLDKEDLFLATGFKSMISLKISSDILNWFGEKLVTVVDFNEKEPLVSFNESEDNEIRVYRNKMLDKLIKIADFGPQEIGYIKDNNTGKYSLNSFYTPKGAKEGVIISSKTIESKGTLKLIDFWIRFMEYFKKGGIFILDEFDCSIHPELIGGIIDLFNDRDVNINNAQLIYNTHNPLYLQKRFFRRDQIMFVEKDEESYISYVYKLSDFDLRNDVNYMKNYFEGKFGALPFIDFESALNIEKGAE